LALKVLPLTVRIALSALKMPPPAPKSRRKYELELATPLPPLPPMP
jgi:hypothetical protein